MELRHRNIRGKESIHWYTSIKLSDSLTVNNALIDTGASFTTLECRILALLNYQDIDEFKNLIRKTCKDTVVPRLAMDILRCYNIKLDGDVASAVPSEKMTYTPDITNSSEIKVLGF